MALALSSQLEAVLFASGEPLTKVRLAKLFDTSAESVQEALDALRTMLDGRGLSLVETDGEVELRTSSEASDAIKRLRESELSRDLGKASLETLALILYKGSATRGEIDWVRGVNSAAAVRALSLRGLVERYDDPDDKRRARYRATVGALSHLGVEKREQLPRYTELSEMLSTEEKKALLTEITPDV